MRENTIRCRWQADEAVVNGWLSIPSAFSAELMAHQGWDSITVDLQHGIVDYQMAVTMLQAISTTPTMPLVRVPWLDPGIIMRMLDAGAFGVICPMINNREETESLVAACRYPPDGNRSFGPIRAMLYGGADYYAHANASMLAIAMIETREALDKLDDIMSTPGLDGIYVGPSDLSLALGRSPSVDPEDPVVVEAIAHILARAKAHGVAAGIHTAAPAYARRMVEQGYRFVTVGTDGRFIANGAKETLAAMRAGPAPAPNTGSY